MSFSRSIINGMHISALFMYLKNANDSLTLLLKNPLSHSIRIRPVIKSHTIKLVENIMELYNKLETLDAEIELLSQTNLLEVSDLAKRYLDVHDKMKHLKEVLINLLDNDFEDKFVKKLRLDLNDYVTLYVLTKHAENKLKNLKKLGHVEPEIVSQAIMAKNLATNAKEMRNSLDSIDPTSTPWTMDVEQDDQENMIKKYIADATAIFHGIDEYEYMHKLSINKAGKIIKRRIRKTKRRNINSRIIKRINSRSRNKRNNRSSRRTR
jgi:hypothetical protein